MNTRSTTRIRYLGLFPVEMKRLRRGELVTVAVVVGVAHALEVGDRLTGTCDLERVEVEVVAKHPEPDAPHISADIDLRQVTE